jgi:hypothetical protein
MIPTLHKSKIPKAESYPLKAGEISEALAAVPQFGALKINFHRLSRSTERMKLMWVHYVRPTMSLTSPKDHADWLEPRWNIYVHTVPRALRHRINGLLRDEALPKIVAWLNERGDITGRFSADTITVYWDDEYERLVTEQESRMM